MDHTNVAIAPEPAPAAYAGRRMEWRDAIRWPLLAVSALLWLVVAGLTVLVATHPFLALDACQFFYECTGCGTLLRPKPGDCCLFCSYGSVPCPPVQQQRPAPP